MKAHAAQSAMGAEKATESVIVNGVPWFDDDGHVVNAHGVCLLEAHGRYYLYGEYKTDDENKFIGVSCYSSEDLCHWTFERLALPLQSDGLLGPDRIGERPKVMHCPKTGQYVMFVHADDLHYLDPVTVVAVADAPDDEFRMVGPLMYEDEPLRLFDIGTFQELDGTGYLLAHEGEIYELADDYLSVDKQVAKDIAIGGESPAMFLADGTYYLLMSNKTCWGSNDNYYLTAPSIAGPWTHRGLFAPEGSCTFDSQCSFVFPLQTARGIVPLYMGDRWSFPHQASTAAQVWLPIETDESGMRLTQYWAAWNPVTCEPVSLNGAQKDITFRSNVLGTVLQVPFTGTGIAIHGVSNLDGAYARISIADVQGETICAGYGTFYGPVENTDIRYLSPRLPYGDYTLTVMVSGDLAEWFYKSGERHGCTDVYVDVRGATVFA